MVTWYSEIQTLWGINLHALQGECGNVPFSGQYKKLLNCLRLQQELTLVLFVLDGIFDKNCIGRYCLLYFLPTSFGFQILKIHRARVITKQDFRP
jgi:hypothetical protein